MHRKEVESTGSAVSRRNDQGLTAGFAFIAIALAILVCWLAGDWWLLPPVLLLEFGIYAIVMGFLMPKDSSAGSSDATYFLIWGGLLTLLGAFWMAGRSYSVDITLLIVAIFLFLGCAIMVRVLMKSRKSA